MKNMDSETEERYRSHFQTMLHRISCRRSTTREMCWLFDDENNLPFIPDYLVFHTVGRKAFERHLNRALFRLSDRLWYHLFWPRIRSGLLRYMHTTYFPIFFQNSHHSDRAKKAQEKAFSTIKTFLTPHWDGMGQCTFSEMGILVNEILKDCSSAAGCPEDIFLQEKKQHNQVALEAIKKYHPYLSDKDNILDILIFGACHSNWLDILEKDIEKHLKALKTCYDTVISSPGHITKLAETNPYFQLDRFKLLIREEKQILFECDNCGEVVFDLLLIQHLVEKGHKVVISAKTRPALNDVTGQDIETLLDHPLFSFLKIAFKEGRLSIITIDSVMGGKLLYEASAEYKAAYEKANLLILKGQGNFQTMPMGIRLRGKFVPYRYKKPMVFLLPVKSVMSRLCLQSIFKNQPQAGSLMLYCYDPADPATYPQ